MEKRIPRILGIIIEVVIEESAAQSRRLKVIFVLQILLC